MWYHCTSACNEKSVRTEKTYCLVIFATRPLKFVVMGRRQFDAARAVPLTVRVSCAKRVRSVDEVQAFRRQSAQQRELAQTWLHWEICCEHSIQSTSLKLLSSGVLGSDSDAVFVGACCAHRTQVMTDDCSWRQKSPVSVGHSTSDVVYALCTVHIKIPIFIRFKNVFVHYPCIGCTYAEVLNPLFYC